VGLGGGREKKGDPIDHTVGIVMHVRVGDHVAEGQPLFTVHAATEAAKDRAADRILRAIRLGPDPVPPLPHFYERIV